MYLKGLHASGLALAYDVTAWRGCLRGGVDRHEESSDLNRGKQWAVIHKAEFADH